jgi:hypothetical protein
MSKLGSPHPLVVGHRPRGRVPDSTPEATNDLECVEHGPVCLYCHVGGEVGSVDDQFAQQSGRSVSVTGWRYGCGWRYGLGLCDLARFGKLLAVFGKNLAAICVSDFRRAPSAFRRWRGYLPVRTAAGMACATGRPRPPLTIC